MDVGGIGEWITRRADRKGSAVALIDGATGRETSYGELRRRTSALAAGLHELGVRQGDRVALLWENAPEFLDVLFAAAELGAITVPVNTRLSAPEVAYVLADSGAVLLAVSDRLRALGGEALAHGPHRVTTVLGGTEDGALEGLAGTTVERLVSEHPGGRPAAAVRGDDICVIMYTSGTTGRPKGAMLTHANMFWNALNLVTVGGGLSGQTVTIAVAPLFHIGALGLSALPILYAGGTVVLLPAFDPKQTLELIQRHRVTTQFMVPAMWAAMMSVPDFDAYDASSVGYALCGGAPCPLPVIDFYQGKGWTFLEGFGMTELSPNTLMLDAEFVRSRAGSVGRPFLHVEARLVDDEDRDVPPGVVGELVLRGPNVFDGYWGRPVETAEAMRGGWFHSGDLGRADDEGFITLVDRKKDMVISGGENVYPIEVEQVLHRHPAVADVAVIGAPDPTWGEVVVAVVVGAPGTTATAEELIDHARERLAHFKCPRRVVFVDELPRNATGKLLKRLLRERFTGSAESVTR